LKHGQDGRVTLQYYTKFNAISVEKNGIFGGGQGDNLYPFAETILFS